MLGLAVACLVASGALAQAPPASGGPCAADDWRALCLAGRAFAVIDALPADEQPAVVGTLLAVHVRGHDPPPPELLAAARRIARQGKASDRLQVLVPLAELAREQGDRSASARFRQLAERDIARLGARRDRPQNFLQIADFCVGLFEIHSGVPVAATEWGSLYRRSCQPAFFARLKERDGFSRVVRRQLKLVGQFLVGDRAAFAGGVGEMVLTLRAVEATLRASVMSAAEREAGELVAAAMLASLGALTCELELEAECRAILGSLATADEIGAPGLWSTWAAVEAVRGEALILARRPLEAAGVLSWLIAEADEPSHAAYRAAFLASAAWLADRVQGVAGGRAVRQSI